MIENYVPDLSCDIITYTFKMLDSLKVGTWTKFQTVFDIRNRVIYFKSLQNSQFRYFRFNAFDFSCETVSKMLDINANLSGDVTEQFIDYNWLTNETMIRIGWEGLGSTNIYPPALQIISRYPETFVCTNTIDVNESKDQVPQGIELNQNYPNPFNPETIITYQLPEFSLVEIKVYDMLGGNVATLVNKVQNAGTYKVNFSDTEGLSSGLYLYSIKAGGFFQIKKMMLLK